MKSRANGALNPYAFFREPVTMEQVLQSRVIADPLTLLQCCPSTSDGAAALVLSTKKPVNGRRPVYVAGCSIQSGQHKYKINDLLDGEITVRTSGWPTRRPVSAPRTSIWWNATMPSPYRS